MNVIAALLTCLFFFGVLAPALLRRGGQMRQRERGATWGVGAWYGVVKVGIKVEWRVLA